MEPLPPQEEGEGDHDASEEEPTFTDAAGPPRTLL
jgi:hypothetical protein